MLKLINSIRVTGPKIWNALPSKVMEKSNNIPLFKKLIKSHFFLEQNYSWSYVRWVLVSPLCIRKGYQILYGALYAIVLHWSFPLLLLHFLLIRPLSFCSFICVCVGVKMFFYARWLNLCTRKKNTPNDKRVGADSGTFRFWTRPMVLRAYSGDWCFSTKLFTFL